MSRMVMAVALGALTACAGEVPDSNPNARGVGFGDPSDFESARAARDRELAGVRAPVPDDRAIAQDTLAVLNSTSEPSASGTPLATTGMLANNPGISDEQNFDAVASRETIESDRERLERQRAAMQVVTPEAVPERPRSSGPNIVAFALSTSNRVGEPIYNRPSRFNEDKFRRACAVYGSTDQAQAAFLDAGGPKRDRKGLDPDGDGFACRWDPTPFRNARG